MHNMSWKWLDQSIESKKVFTSTSTKKAFFASRNLVLIDHMCFKEFSCSFKKTRFSKIKDLNRKNKNMTSSEFPLSITSQNLKSSNANLKILVTHFDTMCYMKQYDRIFCFLWVPQCRKFQKKFIFLLFSSKYISCAHVSMWKSFYLLFRTFFLCITCHENDWINF